MRLFLATIEFVLAFAACVAVIVSTMLLAGVAATFMGVL